MCSSVVPVLQQHVKNLKRQNEKLLQRCEGNKSGCDIPDIALNRANRIGKNNPSEKNVRPVTVRFTTFRHRTMFYQARKNLSKNGVHLDLTKERFTLYRKARDLVKSKKFVRFVYVDVNCQLKVKCKNSKMNYLIGLIKKVILVSSDMELKELMSLMWVKICFVYIVVSSFNYCW